MDILSEIAWHSILIFLWIGSGIAFFVSMAMLIAPEKAARLNRFFTYWIDTHRVEDILDRPRWTERFVYRYHHLTGTALFCGSTLILYRFLLHPPRKHLALLLASDTYGLVEAAVAILVIGAVLGAALGLIMFAKPSVLREIEALANHWVGTEKWFRTLNQMHPSLDRFMLRSRIASFILLIVSAYVVLTLGSLLLTGNWRL